MKMSSDGTSSILFDIVDALVRDGSAGGLKELQHYLRRFPGHDEVVAREYLRAKHARETPGRDGSPRAGAAEVAPANAAPNALPLEERVRRLSQPVRRGARYSKEEAIGSGGMGVVHRVRDLELDRILALKEMKVDASNSSPLLAARFLEEAQVTAQLDHPGIVPVHEVGVDGEGRLFFAMKLVRGRVLRTILDQLESREEGWTLPRVLTVLLKVCEAMAYSHSKGAIHRDLKPANIMVGNFGEVYVMDWGLARVLGRPDLHDLRIQNVAHTASLHTVRRQESENDDASPLLTMDGEVVGTPSYMSPEQASGDLERLSLRSDVYSVGAILYHALTGQAPFVPAGAKVPAHSVLWRLIEGPPVPVAELRPSLPVELVAICEKAMARDPGERYADMGALARDLSAFLEQRVVEAYETGAWAEARKWVRRNKPLAATLATAVVLALASLSTIGYVQAQGRRLAEDERSVAQQERARADREAGVAIKKADEVLRLSALQDLDDLLSKVDGLWPAHPQNIGACEQWIGEARKLVAGLPLLHSNRAELRAKALPPSAQELSAGPTGHPDHQRLVELDDELDQALEAAIAAPDERSLQREQRKVQTLEQQRNRLRTRVEERQDWTFPEGEQEARWWNNQLTRLIDGLEDLERGLLAEDETVAVHGWSIPKRLAIARTLQEGFAEGGQQEQAWSAALPAIRATYPGLRLTPELDLVPIGPDPGSGLWEFAHLHSGDPVRRGPDGKLVLTQESGLVFVLLPGGTYERGAQSSDPQGRNYDPHARPDESPVHRVTVSPFFLSKFEMTQGQWLVCVGKNPSAYLYPEGGSSPAPMLHPVEQVSWDACMETCRRMGLSLPSEAQWEYAARAGTDSVWWTGNERESLAGAANLADQAAARADAPWEVTEDWPDLDDGYARHAPVGTYRANPFGLHDVHGNVWEWCLDGTRLYRGPVTDPVEPATTPTRVNRGGAFDDPASYARSGIRAAKAPNYSSVSLGLRPARALTPQTSAAR